MTVRLESNCHIQYTLVIVSKLSINGDSKATLQGLTIFFLLPEIEDKIILHMYLQEEIIKT